MRILPRILVIAIAATAALSAPPTHADSRATSLPLDTAAIDQAIGRLMVEQNIPGAAIAIVHKGELRYAKGYGKANLEHDIAATADSVFAIASVSKPLIALGVAKLVEQGKLAWNDPIQKHLPGTPDTWRAVTLAHLANHTSGIVRESPAFEGDKIKSDFEVVAAAYPVPLAFPTGTKMQYCNVCYFALAEIITRTAGEPWQRFMDREVFQAAGAKDTRPTSVRDLVPRRAASYEWKDGKHHNVREYVALRPSGAFLSTVNDLARIEAALTAGKLVKPDSLKLAETPARLNDGTVGKMNPNSAGYGLGWELFDAEGKRRVAHGGTLAGFRTMWARYPDQGWAVIILTNGTSARPSTLEAAVVKLLPNP
ncbi:MAG: serine hydrolase domain-containing protein [Burkholderiales bacterium]|nr:serine hydrolase domain-containing protein [Burkholderiales bacterium]